MPQSVNQWKNNKNINEAVPPNSLQSVSAWKSTQPVMPPVNTVQTNTGYLNSINSIVLQPAWEALKSGIEQGAQGLTKAVTGKGAINRVEGILQLGSGVAGALSAPIAPVMKAFHVNQGIDFLGKELASIPGYAKLVHDNPKKAELAKRLIKDGRNLAYTLGLILPATDAVKGIVSDTGKAVEGAKAFNDLGIPKKEPIAIPTTKPEIISQSGVSQLSVSEWKAQGKPAQTSATISPTMKPVVDQMPQNSKEYFKSVGINLNDLTAEKITTSPKQLFDSLTQEEKNMVISQTGQGPSITPVLYKENGAYKIFDGGYSLADNRDSTKPTSFYVVSMKDGNPIDFYGTNAPVKTAETQPVETPKTKQQTGTLTHEQRLNNVLNHEKDLINKTRTGSRQQADLKASGFQLSAIKRGIKGEPTTIEMQKAKAKLTSNFVGKKVDALDIGTGKVTGTSFGKIRVKFSDGSIKSIEPKDIIKTVVSNSDAISYLKDKAINKLKGLESIYNLSTKSIIEKPIKATEIKPTTKLQDLTFKPTESVSKLAQSLKRKAIKDKMIYAFDKRFRDLPVLEKRVKTEDMAKAREFTLNNPNEAFKVAMGEKRAPAGMIPEDILVAVSDYASATKNIDAMAKLTNESGLLQESRGLGQRIQALSQLNPVARKLGDIKKARESKVLHYDKQKGKIIKTIKGEVKTVHLSKKELSWDSFLKEVLC